MPIRIQRRRTKGWRMPPGAIYVGRTGAEHSEWGNPFFIGGYFKQGDPPVGRGLPFLWTQRAIWKPEDEEDAIRAGYTPICDREQAVEWFRWLVGTWNAGRRLRCQEALGGHDLCCWCPLTEPCHADVLLEIANA
jgi:hypothetical protein